MTTKIFINHKSSPYDITFNECIPKGRMEITKLSQTICDLASKINEKNREKIADAILFIGHLLKNHVEAEIFPTNVYSRLSEEERKSMPGIMSDNIDVLKGILSHYCVEDIEEKELVPIVGQAFPILDSHPSERREVVKRLIEQNLIPCARGSVNEALSMAEKLERLAGWMAPRVGYKVPTQYFVLVQVKDVVPKKVLYKSYDGLQTYTGLPGKVALGYFTASN